MPRWPKLTATHEKESGGFKLNVNQCVDWNLSSLLYQTQICNTQSSALRFAKACFFQVIVDCTVGEGDPVAYDLRSFVDPAT